MASLDYKHSDNEGSPSKRLKITAVKDNILHNEYGCELLYIELVQGGYELITVQQSVGQDGYYQPLREDVRTNGTFSKKWGLVKVMTRCVSPDNDHTLSNVKPGSSNGQVYPRAHILRLVDSSNKDSRHSCLKAIASFLNASEKAPAQQNYYLFDLYAKRKNAKLPKYMVAPNFDMTPKTEPLRKLGHLIINRNVVEFINYAYANVTPNWAAENKELSSLFFDAPYPPTAITELGYPRVVLKGVAK